MKNHVILSVACLEILSSKRVEGTLVPQACPVHAWRRLAQHPKTAGPGVC